MKNHPKIHTPVWTTVHDKRIQVQHHGTRRADGRSNYFVTEPYHHMGSKWLGCHWLLPEQVDKTKSGRKISVKKATPKKKKRETHPNPIEVTNARLTLWARNCPFCGSVSEKPSLQKDGSSNADEGPYWVKCRFSECQAQGPECDEQDNAVKAWNERSR